VPARETLIGSLSGNLAGLRVANEVGHFEGRLDPLHEATEHYPRQEADALVSNAKIASMGAMVGVK